MNKFLFFIFILVGFCGYSLNDALKFNLNYDNQSAAVENEFDYVLNRNFARN